MVSFGDCIIRVVTSQRKTNLLTTKSRPSDIISRQDIRCFAGWKLSIVFQTKKVSLYDFVTWGQNLRVQFWYLQAINNIGIIEVETLSSCVNCCAY
jgi:hypothetical protein